MPTVDLYEELRSIVAAFASGRVRYALCGGLALAVHAEPRATKDIDFLVHPDDFDAIQAILRALGYVIEALPMRFSSGLELRRISKVEGTEVFTLDLILVNERLRETWEGREEVRLADLPLWVVAREGLIAMKRMAGRPQDLADLARLEGREGG